MITKRERTPAELGIVDVDMQAAANQQYPSGTIDVRQHFVYTAIVDIAESAAPANGEAKLFVRVISKEPKDNGDTIFEVDIATGIDTTTDLQKDVITFGAGVTTKVFGSGTEGPDAEVFKHAERIQLVLEVTTQNDSAGISTASVTLLAGS